MHNGLVCVISYLVQMYKTIKHVFVDSVLQNYGSCVSDHISYNSHRMSQGLLH